MSHSSPRDSSAGSESQTTKAIKMKDLKQTYERICETVFNGHRIMVLMRGGPGSGKTYAANKMISTLFGEFENVEKFIFTINDYLNETNGNLFVAYNYFISDVENSLKSYLSPIIIDNNNLDSKEMEVYVQLAVSHGYYIETLEPLTSWKFIHNILVQKSKRPVSLKDVRNLMKKYEHNVTGRKLLEINGAKYPANLHPPQPASNRINSAVLESDSSDDDNEEQLVNESGTAGCNFSNNSSSMNAPQTSKDHKNLTNRGPQKNDSSGKKKNVNANRYKNRSKSRNRDKRENRNKKHHENVSRNLTSLLSSDEPVSQEKHRNQHQSRNQNFNRKRQTQNVLLQNQETASNCSMDESISNLSDVIGLEKSPISLEVLEATYKKVFEVINNGHCILILMRGCPGSGKTYAANKLIRDLFGCTADPKKYIFSICDNFEPDSSGDLDPKNYCQAHYITGGRVLKALESATTPVIIDNMNVDHREMLRYARMGIRYGYFIETLEPLTDWKFDINLLYQNCRRFLSLYNLNEILKNYIHNVTGDELLAVSDIKYSRKIPPRRASNIKEASQTDEKSLEVMVQSFKSFPSNVSNASDFEKSSQKDVKVSDLKGAKNKFESKQTRQNERSKTRKEETSKIPEWKNYDLETASKCSDEVSINSSDLKSTEPKPKIEPIKLEELLKTYDKVCKFVNDGFRVMVLMRGCPGSGKTYSARKIISHLLGDEVNPESYIFSTDDWFTSDKKARDYNPTNLDDARRFSFKNVSTALRMLRSPVVIDNTNCEAWEMHKYVGMAIQYGYYVETLEPLTSWKFNADLLAQKCRSFIPVGVVQGMLRRYQHNITGKQLLAMNKTKYDSNLVPPQKVLNKILNVRADSTKLIKSLYDTKEWMVSDSVPETPCANNVDTFIDLQSRNLQNKTQTPEFNSSEKGKNKKSNDSKQHEVRGSKSQPITEEKNAAIYDKVKKTVKDGHCIMVFMRGCRGSGKTFAATKLIEQLFGELEDPKKYIFSVDDFFTDDSGKYEFNPKHLQRAHDRVEANVFDVVKKSLSPVIIDNNNSEVQGMKKLVRMAVAHGYYVETLEPQTDWKYNASVLAEKCIHFLPEFIIRGILNKFEHNITGEMLLAATDVEYSSNLVPPQAASNLNSIRNNCKQNNESKLSASDSYKQTTSNTNKMQSSSTKNIPSTKNFSNHTFNVNKLGTSVSQNVGMKSATEFDKGLLASNVNSLLKNLTENVTSKSVTKNFSDLSASNVNKFQSSPKKNFTSTKSCSDQLSNVNLLESSSSQNVGMKSSMKNVPGQPTSHANNSQKSHAQPFKPPTKSYCAQPTSNDNNLQRTCTQNVQAKSSARSQFLNDCNSISFWDDNTCGWLIVEKYDPNKFPSSNVKTKPPATKAIPPTTVPAKKHYPQSYIDSLPIKNIKIIMLGASRVGKSSFVRQYTKHEFRENVPAPFCSITDHEEIMEHTRVQLEIHDTVGTERFESIMPNYYRHAQGAILMYDVSRHMTFKHLSSFIQNLDMYASPDIQKVIVGSKIDLGKRDTSTYAIQKFAQENGALYFEASAKCSLDIDHVFHSLIKKILNAQSSKETVRSGRITQRPVAEPARLGFEQRREPKKKDCC